MATAIKKPTFEQTLRDSYRAKVERNTLQPTQDLFNENKSKFTLEESFKVKGILHEMFHFYGDTYAYLLIFVAGELVFYEYSASSGKARDLFDSMIGITGYDYFNGCPHYSLADASIIEVIKTEKRLLAFHKIYKSRAEGCPLKAEYEQIPNTPFSIGKPVMYNMRDGKNNFFYADSYQILKYDLAHNLSIGKKFNTRFCVVSSMTYSGNGTKVKTLDKLIKDLEEQKAKFVSGFWSDAPFTWNEPSPSDAAKLQTQIDAVIEFKKGI